MDGPADQGRKPDRRTVTVDGRRVTLTHLDKVLYPESGFTKADVLDYYRRVSGALLPLITDRPVTRKRWVDGVGTSEQPGQVFFAKNLEQGAPEWVRSREIEHRSHATRYPLVDDLATLTWIAQMATLEIHVPQWRFGTAPAGGRGRPDRLVLDLDPGDGVGLAECAEVARLIRPILAGIGLDPLPVTSGSKGIHLYAPLDGTRTADDVSAVAHELARALEADNPGLVVSDMKKALRQGRVLVDWSQNNGAKTTIAPYSLRGTPRPMAAAPRTWAELDEPDLRQLGPAEVLERLERDGDLLAALHGASEPDALTVYRGRRDPARTPEPVPAEPPTRGTGDSFVIQEHHARRLHWDFRLERDGVLVSWALPRGVPDPGGRNHLAVHTEDHPLEYGSFEGDIPAGEYGGGHVTIWDSGTYSAEKFRDGEVIATLTGRPDGGLGGGPVRVALIRTGSSGRAGDPSGEQWLIHRMDLNAPHRRRHPEADADARTDARPHAAEDADPGADADADADAPTGGEGAAAPSTGVSTTAPPKPMLATPAPPGGPDPHATWSLEMKWDGVRAIAVVEHGAVRLVSRNDLDLTPTYPELQVLVDHVDAASAVLDGEIVALDAAGRPSFARLQQRFGLTRLGDVERARRKAPVRLLLFDVLAVDGRSLEGAGTVQRRARLEALVRPGDEIDVPPVVGDGTGAGLAAAIADAMATSARLGFEGVLAKRADAPYAAGRRSADWLKLKHQRAQEVVVAGWRPGAGRRAGGIGSLLVAVPDSRGALAYVGRVGTGFSDDDLDAIALRLAPLASTDAPATGVPALDARDAHWVSPELVGEVSFAGWTGEGRLRQASWRGWRPDKAPADVVREEG